MSPEDLEALVLRVFSLAAKKVFEAATCTLGQGANRCNNSNRSRSGKGKERAGSQTSTATSMLVTAETPEPTGVQQEVAPGRSATRGDSESLLEGQGPLLTDVAGFESLSNVGDIDLGFPYGANLETMFGEGEGGGINSAEHFNSVLS